VKVSFSSISSKSEKGFVIETAFLANKLAIFAFRINGLKALSSSLTLAR